ncbi:MAG TPA: HK97 family phage prohead protease, partial [Candidatus Bathyarchaeia archaeon]|nr:HK97 family phage prohead protease [Candidatus Bathyarchaeia archaeon]
MQIPKKNKDDVERRFVANDVAEIRLKEEQDKPTKIVGYFAKFNKLSRNLGGFKEKIEPGFFADAIKNSDTVDLFNHDFNYILGRKSAGTLRVWEDDVGLAYECDAPTTQLIKDLVISPIRRGEITGNSFGFTMNGNGDVWEEDEEGRVVRTLKKNGCRSLIDGSQVVNPAYLDTSVALRSMEKWQEEKSGVKPRYEGDGTKPVEEETGKTDTTIDD